MEAKKTGEITVICTCHGLQPTQERITTFIVFIDLCYVLEQDTESQCLSEEHFRNFHFTLSLQKPRFLSVSESVNHLLPLITLVTLDIMRSPNI